MTPRREVTTYLSYLAAVDLSEPTALVLDRSIQRAARDGAIQGQLGTDGLLTAKVAIAMVAGVKKWWAFPVFLISFAAWGVLLPFFPPMRALLRAIACDADETYELVRQTTGTESATTFTCVKPDGSHLGYDSDTPTPEIVAFFVDAGVSLVLSALPFAVVWWRRRRMGADGAGRV